MAELLIIGCVAYFVINTMVLIIGLKEYFDDCEEFGYDDNMTSKRFFGVIALIFFFACPIIIQVISSVLWERIKYKIGI